MEPRLRSRPLWTGIFVLLCALLNVVKGQSSTIAVSFNIKEELPVGESIGNVASEARSQLEESLTPTEIQSLRYDLMDEVNGLHKYFKVDERSGEISIAQVIDRDKGKIKMIPDSKISLKVGTRPNNLFKIINLDITIMDINDNAPTFSQKKMVHLISESTPEGTTFSLPIASDPDSEENGVQKYELDSTGKEFELNASPLGDGSVVLVLKTTLDREVQAQYQMTLYAYDGGDPQLTGSVLINVSVEDANDNHPYFRNDTYNIVVPEDHPIDVTLLTVQAFDSDAGLNGQLSYTLSARTRDQYGELFTIEETTGKIKLAEQLDYEGVKEYSLVIEARDNGPGGQPAHATVHVQVEDVNDNAPQITLNTLTQSGRAEIAENGATGIFVAHISVIDMDSGVNGDFTCNLNSMQFQLQQIDKNQYKVISAMTLDREVQHSFNLTFQCQDAGKNRKTSEKHIPVDVQDENDHDPEFNPPTYLKSIQENNQINAFIVEVNATDRDAGSNAEITYSLAEDAKDYFNINPKYGTVRANVVYDHENMKGMTFHVIASDGGTPPRSASAEITISITDINDEPPRFTQPNYSFGVFENKEINSEVGTVLAVDLDTEPYSQFEYAFEVQTEETFTINPFTGNIKTLRYLDREVQSVYFLTVVATNVGVPPLSSSASVTIYVADQNDSPPVFDYPSKYNNTLYVSNEVPKGYVLGRVRAHDDDIGLHAKLTYSIIGGNEEKLFDMDAGTGAITTNKDLNMIEDKTFEMLVKATDGGGGNGDNPLTTRAYLNVVVNKSIAYMPPPAGMLLRGNNLTIVVSLAAVSGVIVVILIIAIVVLKCQDSKAPRHNYNCRTEAQRMLPGREDKLHSPVKKEKDAASNSSNGSSMDNGGSNTKSNKKEVSFNIEVEDDSGLEEQTSRESVDDGRHHGSFHYPHNPEHSRQIRAIANPQIVGAPGYPPPSYMQINQPQQPQNSHEVSRPYSPHHAKGRPVPPPNTAADKDMEVHKLLELLKRDQDADSSCSGEMSNADSGKGPSEEGEGPSHHPGYEGCLESEPATMTAASENQSQQPPLPPRRWGAPPQRTYSGQKHMNTFAPMTNGSPHGVSQQYHNHHNHHQTLPAQHRLDGRHSPAKFAPYSLPRSHPHSPGQAVPLQTLSVPYPEQLRNLSQTQLGNGGAAGRQQHCDKFSSSPWNSLERPQHCDSTSLGDDNTTTSGSYSVDPEDLCQEIDDMFFVESVA